MFTYEYPEFEKKHLLTAEMLEQLRDHPRHYSELMFYGYGNGIVNGCGLSWEENRLTVDKGILYWNGNLYFMKEPYALDCFPENQLRYLKVKFLKEEKQPGKIRGGTSIYLSKEPVDSSCEMELCRFRLQVGARLRSSHQDFRDYATEYDTINIIHAPFASASGTTMNPKILLQYAEEMLETEMTDAFDIVFVMNLLANDGRVSRMVIKRYVMRSSRRDNSSDTNGELYQELLSGLSNRKRQRSGGDQNGVIQKRIMLM